MRSFAINYTRGSITSVSSGAPPTTSTRHSPGRRHARFSSARSREPLVNLIEQRRDLRTASTQPVARVAAYRAKREPCARRVENGSFALERKQAEYR